MAGKKFQFRLEAVLKLRRLEAERAKARLGDALRRVVEARERLRRGEEELESLLGKAIAGHAVHDLRRFAETRSAAIDRIETIREQLLELQAQETEARHELASRMRDQQALEDLKERQKEQFEEAHAYREQQMLDELGVIGFGRKKSSHVLPCE